MSFLFFFSLQSGGEKVRETMGSVWIVWII